MSEVDEKIVRAIVSHGGSVSLYELMSLLDDVADADIEGAVKRLESDDLLKLTESGDKADPLLTIREKELERQKKVA